MAAEEQAVEEGEVGVAEQLVEQQFEIEMLHALLAKTSAGTILVVLLVPQQAVLAVVLLV